MVVALYAVGGVLQLVGVSLVVLEVREARRKAAQEFRDAGDMGQAYGGMYSVGLGGAQVQADLAVRHLEYLHRANAAWLQSDVRRAKWGGTLIAIGIVATTAAGIVSAC